MKGRFEKMFRTNLLKKKLGEIKPKINLLLHAKLMQVLAYGHEMMFISF